MALRYITAPDFPNPITADQVDAVRFTPVRLREGYTMREVDEFIDRISATLRGEQGPNSVTAQDVEKVLFTPVRVREGYDMGEVDMFLDVVVATLNADGGATVTAIEPEQAEQAEASSDLAPLHGPFTTCGICFVPVRVADENAHRGWHVGRLG